MKKLLKIASCFVLAVCFAVPLTGCSLFENIKWVYDETTKTLTISGEGKIEDYNDNSENNGVIQPWYDCEYEKLVIEEGITVIGSGAFETSKSNIKTISLPSTLKTIKSYAFSGGNYKKIVIPDGVQKIENNAFSSNRLQTIVLGKSVEQVSKNSFETYSNYKKITVSDENPYFTAENNVLYSKDKKQLVWYANSISGERAFFVPDTVEKICKNAFEDNINLRNVTFGKNLSEIDEGAFFNTKINGKLVFSEGLISIGKDAFSISDIVGVKFPKSLVKIGESAFSGCEKLKSVTLPDNLKSFGYNAFMDCDLIKKYKVSEGNTDFKAVNGVLYSYDEKTLISYPYGKKDKEYVSSDILETVKKGAFSDISDLETLTFGESVKTFEFGSLQLDCQAIYVLADETEVTGDKSDSLLITNSIEFYLKETNDELIGVLDDEGVKYNFIKKING